MTFQYTDYCPVDAHKLYVDASLLKKSYCDQAFMHTINGLRSNEKNDNLIIGLASHKYVQELHTAGSLQALTAALSVYTSAGLTKPEEITKICLAHRPNLIPPPINIKGKLFVEHYFEIPWLVFSAAGKTYCIIICGTIDHLSLTNNTLKIYDYKTTSKYKTADALAGYDHDVQFEFYAWVLWKFGHRILDLEHHNAIVTNGIESHVVVVHKGSATVAPRWVVGPPKSHPFNKLEAFEAELKHFLHTTFSALLDESTPPRRNGMISNQCSSGYGCPFQAICYAIPGMEAAVLRNLYHKKAYLPSNHS